LPVNKTTLVGSASDDAQPVGAALVYSWTVVSGPGTVVFATSGAATTLVTVGSVGTYVLRLTVSDSELAASDEVTVEILPPNLPPTVDARPDREIDAAETLLIEAAVSDDGLPPPPALTLAWSKVSGPGAVVFSDPSAATTSVQFGQTGTYVLRLTAHDGALSASDDVSVTVRAGNVAPVVSAGPDRTLQKPASVLTLSGSASDDGLPAGSSLSVLWSVVSGPGPVVFTTPASPVSQASFTSAGTYVLRLTATDTAATRSDDVTVVVLPQNQAPLVNAGPDQNLKAPPASEIVLLGSVSDDGLPPGASLVSLWQQLSGPAAVLIADPSSLVTTTSLPALGVYVFRLRASDSLLQAFDDVTVRVADGNQPPSVDAGPDQTIVAPAYTATLSGVVADDGLPVGSTLSAQWSLVTGPALPAFANAASPLTTVNLPSPGTYVLRLVASDSVHTRVDTTSVTLQAAPPVGPPPVVAILSPADGSALTEPASIVGTVASEALQRWTLEYRAAGDGTWLLLGEGAVPVTAAPLGALDPTLLLNGVYELRLTATDLAARTTRVSSSVVVRDNQKVGHFSVSFVDLEVPVAGLPIRITRTYDSRDKARGDFGHGWRLSLSDVKIAEASNLGLAWTASTTPGGTPSYCLSLARSAVVTVTLPDGQTFEFDPKLNRECWSFVPPTAVTLSFKARPGTVGSLSVLDGADAFITTSWPSPGQSHATLLVSAIEFDTLDPDLYQLTLPDGRAFVVRQGKGLQSLTDLNGNRLTVSPNGIQYQNPAVAGSALGVSFQRDGLGRIQSITDPLGNVMRYEYDGAGDLVTFKDREENATTFTYEPAFPHHLRDIQDPLGRTPIKNEYYDDGRLKSHTDAFGNTILYTHNLSARQEIVTDREDGIRVLDYDARGNVVRETDPTGKVILRSFDANNNRTCETEAHDPSQSGLTCETSPNPTLFVYDAKNNLLSQTDPEGNTTSFTYNSRNQVLKTKDALQNETENVYDAKGNLTKTTDALGTETLFEYDASGNVTKQTVTVGAVPHTTEFQYDARGNVKKEIDPLGNETSFTYDGNGNRLTETRTRTLSGGSIESLTTTFVYDKLARLVETIDPDGSLSRTVYDSLGKQIEIYDKLNRKTEFQYDAMGQLSKITYPDLTFEQFTYDKEGRRLTSKDRGGRTTTFAYDGLGRLTKTTFPDATLVENVFDAAGRLTQTIDARGKITRFEYDGAGRRKKVIDPLLNETEFFYDGNGNQTGIKDPKGKTTNFEYDALIRRTKTIFPDLMFTETGYDELGRRTSETDQAGIVTGFEYDELGRLTKVIQDVNGLALETTYAYDEVGNRISQTDANLHTTTFEYDRLGRETKRTLPDATFETKAYDAAGNLTTWTKFDGSVVEYVYDVNNRLVTKDFPSGTDVTFGYTPTGRRNTVTDARGVTSYDYDLRDRLQTLTYPDGRKLDYGYDANGNRTSLTATIGPTVLTTTYSYDDASRLDVVTDPNGLTYDHDYDLNGNRAALSYPNGTDTTYTYDDLNRLTDLTTTGPSGAIQSYQFTLGPAGNRTQIDEADGTVRAYEYDDLYRLTIENVTNGIGLVYQKGFVYDDVGNRLNQTTTGQGAAVVGYTYDIRDRLLTETAATYGYDANGNLTSKSGEATYTWDLEDRLIRVEKNDGTVVAHEYDTDGVRVRTTTTPVGGSSSVTDSLVDTSGFLSHVVAESDGSGAFVAYYVRGDDLLSVVRPTEQRFYHADGLGSIRFLTNEFGNVTDSYTYTAFGEQFTRAGSDNQPYQFAGEPYEPNIGFYYNRARWLDPSVGRFASTDPWEPRLFDPSSLHRYLYVGNDPINLLDSTGLFSFASTLSVISGVLTTLNTISTIQAEGVRAALENLLVDAVVAAVGGAATIFAIKLFRNLIKAGRTVRQFRTFTRSNFRRNLEILTGGAPPGAQAHHVFPVKFEATFQRAGINIHDPLHGSWWNRAGHLQNAAAYNRDWDNFLQVARSQDEILEFGRQLAGRYGIQVFF
jgi:RHS repeat-associated protein